MKIKLDDVFMPTRAHEDDAGLDLYATKGGWIFPKSRRKFGTGLHVAIPPYCVGLLTSKSGLMDKKGIQSEGTIDSGYTGEVKAVLFNHSWRFYKVERGQKITQLVIVPKFNPKLEIVSKLEDTERGTGGFGSTGK